MFKKFLELLKRKNNQKGFTLVELMVVVVIIGILVAIAVPVYNSSIAAAEANACKANQRTIDSVLMQWYANGNTTVPTKEDLVGKYITEWPKCKGAEYAIPTTSGAMTVCPNNIDSHKR